MSKIEEPRASASVSATQHESLKQGPALPPTMTEPKQSVDELVAEMKKSPFFMTSLEDVGDEENPALDAIKALIYEGSRGEIASNFKEQGNEDARTKNWKDAKEQYTKGLTALKAPRKEEDPTGEDEDKKESNLRELLLVNRALCHLELSRSIWHLVRNICLLEWQKTFAHVLLIVWLLYLSTLGM
jgi:hypothetical protein